MSNNSHLNLIISHLMTPIVHNNYEIVSLSYKTVCSGINIPKFSYLQLGSALSFWLLSEGLNMMTTYIVTANIGVSC